ncbi:MAG: hypothetical protein QG573_320, partial [Acidobacteriota bacterium]|nr:hypothetical protein [Acidobacteriota bacterium]
MAERSGGPERRSDRRRLGCGTWNTILPTVTFFDEGLWSRLSPLLDQVLELEGEPRDDLVRELVRSLRERDPELAEAFEQ